MGDYDYWKSFQNTETDERTYDVWTNESEQLLGCIWTGYGLSIQTAIRRQFEALGMEQRDSGFTNDWIKLLLEETGFRHVVTTVKFDNRDNLDSVTLYVQGGLWGDSGAFEPIPIPRRPVTASRRKLTAKTL